MQHRELVADLQDPALPVASRIAEPGVLVPAHNIDPDVDPPLVRPVGAAPVCQGAGDELERVSPAVGQDDAGLSNAAVALQRVDVDQASLVVP